jgi:hypothetical protein
MLNPQLTRRDFLKLVSAGTLAFALKDLRIDHALAAAVPTQGRIVFSGIPLYDAPTFAANKIYAFGKDEVVQVNGMEENGELGNPFNSVWYKIRDGYAYSGYVIPVETHYQKPVFNIPTAGQVGEISVPFSDSRLAPYVYAKRGGRLYHGSTHWVKEVIVTREEKSIWYKIFNFHLKTETYVSAHDLRLIPPEELTLLSPDVPEDQKHIVIDLPTQMVTAFEGEKLVFSQRCSSGSKGTETPKGEFKTYHKGSSMHMTNEGDSIEQIYNLPGVPWCSFFTGAGNAFHGTYWHNDYGRPRSHGCVNLPTEAAKFIFRWTRPNVPADTPYLHVPGEGTKVQIF